MSSYLGYGAIATLGPVRQCPGSNTRVDHLRLGVATCPACKLPFRILGEAILPAHTTRLANAKLPTRSTR